MEDLIEVLDEIGEALRRAQDKMNEQEAEGNADGHRYWRGQRDGLQTAHSITYQFVMDRRKLPTLPPYNYQHDPACPQYQNAGSGMPCTCGQLFGL